MGDDSDMCPTRADSESAIEGDTWTIIVAAGSGLRFGSRKQFAELGGRPVVQWSVDAAASVSSGIVIAVPEDAVDAQQTAFAGNSMVTVVVGGDTRAASVRAGVAALPGSCKNVLVHDAARPLASALLFSKIVDALRGGAGAVVPAVALTDTIRRRNGGAVDRAELLAVQTPQGFHLDVLRGAHHSGADATDDATLVEAAGGTVLVIDGEAENRKITEAIDLVTFDAVLNSRGASTST